MNSKSYIKVCEVCGSTYNSSRSHSTVCGNKCRLDKHKNKHLINTTVPAGKQYKLVLHTHVNYHIDLEIARLYISDKYHHLFEPDTTVYIKLFRHPPKTTFLFVYELVDKTVLQNKKVIISEETVYRIPRVKK